MGEHAKEDVEEVGGEEGQLERGGARLVQDDRYQRVEDELRDAVDDQEGDDQSVVVLEALDLLTLKYGSEILLSCYS